MKLKLLLCYILVAYCSSMSVFSLENEESDDSDNDDEMTVPQVFYDHVGVSSGATVDPYTSSSEQSHKIDFLAVDPYAPSSTPFIDVVEVDPYAPINMEDESGVVKKNDKRLVNVVEKKVVALEASSKKSSPGSLDKKVDLTKQLPAKKTLSNAQNFHPPLKQPFVPREKLTLTAALFKSINNNDDPLAYEAQAAVQAIDNEIKNSEKNLQKAAEEHLVAVTREITEQAAQLRKEADLAAKELRATTEHKVQELLETAEQRIARLNAQVTQKSIELKQDAALKALHVIDAMEQRAAERRIKERKQALAQTFGFSQQAFDKQVSTTKVVQKNEGDTKSLATTDIVPLPLKLIDKNDTGSNVVKTIANNNIKESDQGYRDGALRVSAEWKNDISRRFYENMAMMRGIILDAESPKEVNDFVKKFEEQNKWFDFTLRSTCFVADNFYTQIVAKQNQMDKLMQNQRLADDYLEKLTKNMVLDRNQLNKIRLAILYDLNAKAQERASHLDPAVRESGLPEDDIKKLVQFTLSDFSQQFRDIAGQFPDIEMNTGRPQLSLTAVPLMAQKLEQELKEVKAEADQSKEQLLTAQQKLLIAEQAAKKVQENLEQERSTKEDLAQKNDSLTIVNAGIKKAALGFVDELSKSNVEIEMALAGAQQDMNLLKGKYAQLDQKNAGLVGQKQSLIRDVEQAKKESIISDLKRSEDATHANQTISLINQKARNEIRELKESSAKKEFSLTADLRNAHERILMLSQRQKELIKDLENQQSMTANLKNSLKAAQEVANKADAESDITKKLLAKNNDFVKEQIELRKYAQERAKITEELAQKTIDSIDEFLQSQRKSAALGKVNDTEQPEFLESYNEQLSNDRTMLEQMKLEMRKTLDDANDSSKELSQDFVAMQDQIEQELQKAHLETMQELALAKNRLTI